MFNAFKNLNTQSEPSGLFAGFFEEEGHEPAVVVHSVTTKVSYRASGVSIDTEHTETTITTEQPADEVLYEEDNDGLYFFDVELVDLVVTSPAWTIALLEYCSQNYANFEVIDRNSSSVTVRFTSPLRSSITKMAAACNVSEVAISWMSL